MSASAPKVHATAIVENGARIGQGAQIGPYCWVGADVEIGDHVVLHSHVVVAGRTRLGARSTVFPFAVLGHPPQDLKYKGEPSELLIGARCRIREHVTMNPGTRGGEMLTRMGDDCLVMAGVHIAHDCELGSHVILVNHSIIGGHVRIGDYAILGGASAVHQFVRIGAHAIVGGVSAVDSDVIPYGSAMGNRAYIAGLNLVGLRRRGFTRESIHELQKAYRLLFGDEGTHQERLGDVEELFGGNALVSEVLNFVRAESPRPLARPRSDHGP